MGLLIAILYKDQHVTYAVTAQEDEVYHLRLAQKQDADCENYLPQKMVIRRKGKIWISDLEDYTELVNKLTAEIINFTSANKLTA